MRNNETTFVVGEHNVVHGDNCLVMSTGAYVDTDDTWVMGGSIGRIVMNNRGVFMLNQHDGSSYPIDHSYPLSMHNLYQAYLATMAGQAL